MIIVLLSHAIPFDALFAQSEQQQPEPILPVVDAYIASGKANEGWADEPGLWIGNNTSDGYDIQRILLAFDLDELPSDTEIETATLRLYVVTTTENDAPMVAEVKPILGAWNDEITWRTHLRLPIDSTQVVTTEVASELGWYEWDVTTLVQDYRAENSTQPFSLLLSGYERTDDRERAFWSTECPVDECGEMPGRRPQLLINQEQPASERPLGSGTGTQEARPVDVSASATPTSTATSSPTYTPTSTSTTVPTKTPTDPPTFTPTTTATASPPPTPVVLRIFTDSDDRFEVELPRDWQQRVANGRTTFYAPGGAASFFLQPVSSVEDVSLADMLADFIEAGELDLLDIVPDERGSTQPISEVVGWSQNYNAMSMGSPISLRLIGLQKEVKTYVVGTILADDENGADLRPWLSGAVRSLNILPLPPTPTSTYTPTRPIRQRLHPRQRQPIHPRLAQRQPTHLHLRLHLRQCRRTPIPRHQQRQQQRQQRRPSRPPGSPPVRLLRLRTLRLRRLARQVQPHPQKRLYPRILLRLRIRRQPRIRRHLLEHQHPQRRRHLRRRPHRRIQSHLPIRPHPRRRPLTSRHEPRRRRRYLHLPVHQRIRQHRRPRPPCPPRQQPQPRQSYCALITTKLKASL